MTTTIVTTAASVTKLVNDVPDILANTVLNAVVGNVDVSRSILSTAMYGFGYGAGTKFYNYGRDSYVNGLPVSQFVREIPELTDLPALVTTAINSELVKADPSADLVSNVRTAVLTYADVLWLFKEFLDGSPEWATTTLVGEDYNEFTHISTGNIYSYGTAEGWTFEQGNLYMRLLPVSSNPTAPTIEINVPFNFNKFDQVIRVSYEILQTNGETHWYMWHYPPASGVYDYLTFGFGTLSNVGFLPIVPVRIANENIVDAPAHEELAKSATNLLNRINIDLKEFSDNLTNPDDVTAIDDVDNAYIMFAANLNSDEPIAMQYLYEYFKSIYHTQEWTQQEWIDHNNEIGPDLSISIGSRNSIHIKDKWFDVGVDIRLWFNFITVEVKNGLIGDPQPAPDPQVVKPYLSSVDEDNANAADINKSIILGSEWSGVFVGETYSYNTHQFILRKQITTGVNSSFVELVVHGLQHDMLIDERAGKINTNISDIDQGKFFIPITKDIVGLFNTTNESLIYYETLIFLAYAIDVQKLAWYEDPAFWKFVGFVLLVFGIDVTALAVAFSSVQTAIVYLAEAYLIQAVIQEAINQVIDLVGGDVALILAAIATGVAFYYGKTGQISDFLDGETLLKYATLSIEAINTNTQDEFLNMMQEQEDFLEYATDKQEEIDAANDLLSSAGELDIYTLLNSNMYTDYTESPEEFYNRSIHLTNPGVMTLDVIENFTSNALALPNAQTN